MNKTRTYLKKSINGIATACLAITMFSGTSAMAFDTATINEMAFKGEKRVLKRASNEVVFRNVNVIPMTEETVLWKQSVHIKDGKIEEIDDFDDLEISEDAKVINARGKFLMPGLSDMHIHSDEADKATDRILYVANGVTLVRNMWGAPGNLGEREAYRQKQLLGPEFHTTGPLLDGPGSYWDGTVVIEKPEEVAGIIHQIKEDGYDAVKVYDMLTEDVYNEIVAVSKSLDLPVVGHVPYQVGIKKAIAAGQRSIEHMTGLRPGPDFDSNVQEIVDSGVWNCPTMIVMNNYKSIDQIRASNPKELKYVSPRLLDLWSGYQQLNINTDLAEEMLRTLHQQGANLVAGTDVGNPYVIAGFSLHDELKLMNNVGMTPYEVLLTTTVNAAKMIGQEGRLGTVEEGKDADLLLLNRNPLKNIENTKRISGVMVKGTWVPKRSLRRMLKQVEKRYQK